MDTGIAKVHAHRWLIEEPHGELSRGTCRICGAEKLFRNWLQELDFVRVEEAAA